MLKTENHVFCIEQRVSVEGHTSQSRDPCTLLQGEGGGSTMNWGHTVCRLRTLNSVLGAGFKSEGHALQAVIM